MSQVLCPACNKPVALKGIPKHTNGCPQWKAVIGVPSSEFNFDKHFKRRLYAEGLVEGQDYVQCRICPTDVRQKRLLDHLKNVHGLDESRYNAAYPGAPVRLSSTYAKRQATVQERFGVDNVFQAAEVKEKSRETALREYGVEHAQQAPEVKARRAETNIERYGVENPFAAPEVQEKIRETHLERRGVEYPNQDPAVIAKRVETNLERYGVEHFVERPDFQEEFKRASQLRFGTDHPMQSDAGMALFTTAIQEKYGVDNPLLLPEVQKRAYETNLANHGGKHSQQCPEVLAKARETWMEKYGFDNPSKVEEVKIRIKEVWMGKYGVPFPPQSLWTNRTQSFPNGLERAVIAMSPVNVVYTGDGSYWVRHKGASKARNPDFILLRPEQLKAYQEGTPLNDLRTSATMETLGTYWHGPKITGKSRAAHAEEIELYYGRANITCLLLWEDEVKSHGKRVAERIQRFLAKWLRGTYRNEPQPSEGLLEMFSSV